MVMKSRILKIAAALVALNLLGCGAKWVAADGSSATEQDLAKAKAACQVEDKLYQLSYDRTVRDAALSALTDDEARKSVETIYANKEKRAYSEIDVCMNQHGFRKVK